MGLIARTVSSRVVDELSVRLAGATEHAIDEIVRRRSDAIKTAVEVERLRHPECRSTRSRAHDCVPAQQAVRGRRSRLVAAGSLPGRGHGGRDRRRAGRHRRARVLPGRAHPGSRHGVRSRPRRARRACRRRARRARARCRRREVRQARRRGARRRRELDPKDRALAEELNRELGALVVKRTARRRARTLLGREIPFGVGVAIGAGRTSRRCATPAARHCATTSSPRRHRARLSVRGRASAAHASA